MVRLRRYSLLILIIIALLVVGAAAGLAIVSGAHKVLVRLLGASVPWIILIFAAQAVAYWAYVVPYKHIFGLSYKEAVTHAFEGFQPYRAAGGLLYDMSLTKPTGTQVKVFYLGMWEYAALAPIVLVAAIYAYLFTQVPTLLVLPWIIGVPVGTELFLLGSALRRQLGSYRRITRLLDSLLNMFHHKSPAELAGVIGGMLLYWIGEIVAVGGALQLFNVRLGWAPLIVAYATGYAVTRRSLPLGGAGLVLVLLSFALTWVGAGLAEAMLAALAYQVSNLLLPLLMRVFTR